MVEKYSPVSCELYSKLEMWIMHQEYIRLAWRDTDDGDHIGIVRPTDMLTESGSEYLYFTERGDKEPRRVRLDHIVRAELFDHSPD